MDYENLLSGRRGNKDGYSHDRYGHEDDGDRLHRGGDEAYTGHKGQRFDPSKLLSLVGSIPHFKTILAVVAIGFVLILVLGIILLVKLFPLITSVVGYVYQNGFQSIVDYVLAYLRSWLTGN